MAVTTELTRRVPLTAGKRDLSETTYHLDVLLIGATLAVSCLGVLMVFSATRAGLEQQGDDPTAFLVRQLVFLVLGIVVMGVTTLFDYKMLRFAAPIFYVGMLGLLVLVLSPLGTEVNGSQSWFSFGSFQLQPAEFAKLAVLLLLASYCARHRSDLTGVRLVVCLVLAGIPAALIFLQPDIGSMLVFVALVMGLLLVAGARPRYIAALTVVGVAGIIAIFQLGLVEDYQAERFTIFASSGEVDGRGAGYNLDQSKTAIGNGGIWGRGLFEGSQTRLGLVPEQQTDFIFTAVGEELGFAGSVTLLLLYAVIVFRIWRAAALSRDTFGTLVCAGVLSILVFQMFENMGMTMGIMPITGIPLPFMSYGGSSTLTMFAAIGLVLNVHYRRFR